MARLALLVPLVLLSLRARATPPGQSALLNGMHDIESLSWMKGNAPLACDRGWITDLQYIGDSGSASISCHGDATKEKISIIQRLDLSGSESYAHDPGKAAGYGGSFASAASKCPDIHVWIVGNEPNFTVNKSDPDCSSEAYAASYVEVHKRLHATAGHQSDVVLVAPNSPYSPGCLHSLRMILQKIKAKGVTPDGVSIHAYTRAPNGGALNAGYVTSSATQNDGTVDECPGGATWNDTWHAQFRIYKDYIRVMEEAGLGGKPLYITESGNACEPKSGNACYPDADIGYFQALYAEANAHNQSGSQTKIRAITPYRWTKNDDGTGRDFAIGSRSALLGDLKKAFAKAHAWTTPCTSPPPDAQAIPGDLGAQLRSEGGPPSDLLRADGGGSYQDNLSGTCACAASGRGVLSSLALLPFLLLWWLTRRQAGQRR